MRKMITNAGIRTTTIQAPWLNLVAAIVTMTSPVTSAASLPRITIPFENTRRSPCVANWRGMKRSRARKNASRGKSAKAVLRPEIVLGHDVGAATLRVRADRLPVRADDDGDQDRDGAPDGKRVAQRDRARQDQHEEDLLGRVRDGRQRVGREGRERGGLAESFVSLLCGRERSADEEAFQLFEGHGPND